MFLCSGLSSVFQAFVHSCGSFAVCIVLCQRVGIVVIALEVGHKEVSVLGFLIGLRLQCRLDGGKAGVRDRACGQTGAAVSVVGCKDIFRVSSYTGEGIWQILEYLREPGDVLPWDKEEAEKPRTVLSTKFGKTEENQDQKECCQ